MKFFLPITTAFLFTVSTTATGVPLSGTGFTDFVTGVSVNGQNGWHVSGTFDEEVIQDSDGNFVWRISNAITSGAFGNQPFAPRPGGIVNNAVADPVNASPLYFAGERNTGATASKFLAKFDFKSATDSAQDGLSITVSADNGNGGRQSFIDIEDNGAGLDIVSYDVDKNTGEFIGPIYITEGLTYTDWHTVSMEVDFSSGQDIVKYRVDGKTVHVGPSWEAFYRNFQAHLHPHGVPVQTLLFRISGSAVPSTDGNGLYIDNVFTSTH